MIPFARTPADYSDLVTPSNKTAPKFMATVELCTSLFSYLQAVFVYWTGLYGVKTATGAQLDAIGAWVGASRAISVPIEGVYFSWDDTVETGWDSGIWYQTGDLASGVTLLPDDSYRVLIKAKIKANNWDGTTEGLYGVLEYAFPNASAIEIVDGQDMTMTITITDSTISAVTKAIITQGYLPVKPAGVSATFLIG